MRNGGKRAVVFICGLGGSGKSTVGREIAGMARHGALVELDWYATHPTEIRKKRIEDAKSAGDPGLLEKEENPRNWYDWERFEKDLLGLKESGYLEIPDAWNQETGEKDLQIGLRLPQGRKATVFCEGIYLLHDEVVRLADCIVYLAAPERVAQLRSAKRDVHRSSRDYLAYKRYLAEKYDIPYFAQNRRNASLVVPVDGARPDEIARKILESIDDG